MRLADTNILIYAADTAPEEREKRARAAEVLKEEELCLSIQVLQEFYHQATRTTGRLGMSHQQALAFLEPFLELPTQPVTQEVFQTATEIAERYGISYWDAAILAAAKTLGCDAIYSEDLNEGQAYDGIVVVNPFS